MTSNVFGPSGVSGRISTLSGKRGLGFDLLIGAAVAFGQVPFGLWPLALIGLALLMMRLRAVPPKLAFLRALAMGTGHFALALFWITQPFFVAPEIHGWMAPFALVLVSLGMGLFWAVGAWLGRVMGGVVMVALAIAAFELLRGHIFTGFPWALAGHIWAETWLAQMAALVGAYGMTALTLLAVALPLAYGLRGMMVTGLIAALSLGWSAHRLALPEPEARAGLVRIVQPAIAQSLKWDPDEAAQNFRKLLALTENSGADLVIWPETAVPYLVEEGEGAAWAISAAGGSAKVATGLQRNAGDLAYNALSVFGAEGRIEQNFDKIHLVPFGEYIPMGDLVYRLTGVTAFAAQLGAGYSAGAERNLLDFGPLGRALPLICYEAIFPEELATPERGDWTLQVTNDAWFGTLTGPYQHFAQVRLRAIEQGLPLLRAANTGISAFVDARGRVVEGPNGPLLLPLGVEGVLDGQIPGALPKPPYAQFGDIPLAILLLGGLCIGFIRRRRQARP